MLAVLVGVTMALTAPAAASASERTNLPPVDTTHAGRCDFIDPARRV
jgi:hypothetical protein